MRLLNTENEDFESINDERTILHRYAILSHTWGASEVEYKDLRKSKEEAKGKDSYKKIKFAIAQARRDGLKYVWIDTCCINKNSSEELAEAINSMFRWYQNAGICYVYLNDYTRPRRQPAKLKDYGTLAMDELYPGSSIDGSFDHDPYETLLKQYKKRKHQMTKAISIARSEGPLQQCRWFQRGWTLQELLAPRNVQFYDRDWVWLGQVNKDWALDAVDEQAGGVPPRRRHGPFEWMISDITGIHEDALIGKRPISSFSIAQRMYWAAGRQTTREEDRSYSLLGLFGISLPIIYGEGARAFQRLQEELLRVYPDQTIFAWSSSNERQAQVDPSGHGEFDLLARSPDDFRGCKHYTPAQRQEQRVEYQVTTTDMRLKMPVFTEALPNDAESESHTVVRGVLGCRIQHDEDKVLVVELIPVAGAPNFYLIKSGGNRVSSYDHYEAWLKSRTQSITILRRSDNGPSTNETPVPQGTTIICRFKTSTRSFQPWMTCISDDFGAWDEESECFKLPPLSGEVVKFARLRILIKDATYARLAISKRANGKFDVEFRPHENSSSIWMSITNLSPLAMNVHNYVVMIATIGPRKLLNSTPIVLEIETVSLSRILYPLARYLWNSMGESWDQVIWVLLRSFQLPIGILVPIVVVIVARRMAYHGSTTSIDSTLETEEVVLLAAALPVAYIINLVMEFEVT